MASSARLHPWTAVIICLFCAYGTFWGNSVLAQELSPGSFQPESILQKYCLSCHGPQEQEGELRLDQIDHVDTDENSSIWKLVSAKIRSGAMPPDGEKQLTESEKHAIQDWIAARFDLHDPADTDHWSFAPPRRPSIPSPKHDPETAGPLLSPIDAFVVSKLDQVDLELSPRADRRTLIRRLSLDLTGLPPSPEEVRAFVKDPLDFHQAYEKVVGRLLSSVHYGERWAQHWLDVIRWAETVGFETNAERRDAWHYRDWVIRAFNSDMPYDRFLTLQLLGDQTGNDAALGFLVSGPANLPGQIGRDEEAMRQARQDELDEVIRTVSQAMFGLTIGCARCHDHKFDPITQQDYYSMQAIFAGLQYGHRRLRGKQNDAWTDLLPMAQQQLAQQLDRLDSLRQQHSLEEPVANVQSEMFDPVPTRAVRMEISATNKGPASLYEFEVWSTSEINQRHNVALASSGAKVSASSFALANQTRHFDNLTDGNLDRRQAFPWVAASSGKAWIQIEFEHPITIDKVTWHHGSSVPVDYQIRVLDDQSTKWHTVADTKNRLPRIDDLRKPEQIRIDGITPETIQSIMDLLAEIRKQQREVARLAAGPQIYAASFKSVPDPTSLLHRGDPMQPRSEVLPAVPPFLVKDQSAVGDFSCDATCAEPDRRRLLVRHLTDPTHPMTARVIVNRIWQHHFGTGIVETASDMGRMGAEPSHPKLLDWLATEFVANGWSMKHLHRIIVTSRTYTQSSAPRGSAKSVDSESRLLWRFPPRRLDAESIRDSILQVSGKLNRTMYGRGFDFFNQRGGLSDYRPIETFQPDGWRRMIYAHKVRMQSVDIFGSFDCPDAGQMAPQRSRSITPVQSLGLFNSPFVNRQATFLAQRIRQEVGEDWSAQIQHAFEIVFSRPATLQEETRMIDLAQSIGLEQVCRVLMNTSEFVYLN